MSSNLVCLALVSMFAFAACGDAPSACKGCSAEQYCCVGSCQALGTVCGAGDAGSGDLPDASDPCAAHGGATSVTFACAGSSYIACPDKASTSCNTGYACTEWVDGSSALQATCVDPSQVTVCDPNTSKARCMGTSTVFCNANPPQTQKAGPTPPGWLSSSDCTKTWGADAICQLDGKGTPYCSSPGDVPCDPNTFVPTCDELCTPQGAHSAQHPFSCASGAKCVQSAACTNPTCVPASATTSAHAATIAAVYLDCPNDTTVHLEQCGVEWTTSCASLSLGSTTECYAPTTDVVACISTTDVKCNPANDKPSCIDMHTLKMCTGSWGFGTQSCLTNMVCKKGVCCDPLASGNQPYACPT